MSPDETIAGPAVDSSVKFSFQRLMVRKAIFEQVDRAPIAEGETKPKTIQTGLEIGGLIQTNPNAMQGLVTLNVALKPDLKWQPYRIEISVAGFFAAENATEEIWQQFCRSAVPPILFPYVRNLIHVLTVDAAFGLIRLNPINIQDLLSGIWTSAEPKPEVIAPTEP